jgi:methylenetetrahydrofolate reductase (NADPH)
MCADRSSPPDVAHGTDDASVRVAAELVTCGSLEIGAHRPQDAARIAEMLPAGTPVFVNHLPRHALADTLAGLLAVHRAGLEPVPHIAARRVANDQQAREFLERAVETCGVRRVLVVGGDTKSADGPFADAASLLASGLIKDAGVREVALAGYPEGHPRIATAQLTEALDGKLQLAAEQGLGASVVTQFSFAPTRIVEYCADLARRHPAVPVYVGLAGPTNPARLIAYAQRCGVSASLRALQAQGFGAVRLITHTDPTDQLMAVAKYCATRSSCNVVGVHLYTFGGVELTAEWMNRLITGAGRAA